MPRGFMDDLEGEVIGEEVHEGGLGEDISFDDPVCLTEPMIRPIFNSVQVIQGSGKRSRCIQIMLA